MLEKIVDYHSFRVLKKERAPILLICAMYSVRCTRYVKKHGGKVVFYAGNLNDELYYNTVIREKKRLGLNYTDVYSSDYRMGVYRNMFKNIDAVWCLNALSAWSFEGKDIIRNKLVKRRAAIVHPKEYTADVPDRIIIGYFGHTTLLKGVHLLPEAASLCKHKDCIAFVIAGSVDNYVKSVIDRYSIKMTLLGSVPEEKKWSTIQSFDFMVVPSLYDAGPATITEAFMCDVPIIVSSGCGGVERVQNDPKTIVFNTMDIHSLAEKIDYAYEHRSEYLRPSVIQPFENQSVSERESLSQFTDTIEMLIN
ncbi:MAG: glycosyltransferase [Bacteroidales bacterium]|nr:glycosyltransferase [Bacteroidales bacterium]